MEKPVAQFTSKPFKKAGDAEVCIEGKGDQGYKQQKPWEKAQAH